MPDAQCAFDPNPLHRWLIEAGLAGLTECLALMRGFGWGEGRQETRFLGVVLSWATDRPQGWSATERDAIERLSDTLALAARGSSTLAGTRAVLATYLGQDAAGLV